MRIPEMRGSRLELWLATTAIALFVAGSTPAAYAASEDDALFAAAVPMPESANLPPPTAADFAPPSAQPVTGTTARPARTTAAPAAAPAEAAPAMAAPAVRPAAAAPPAGAEPATAATPAATAVLTAVDQEVADRIHELLAAKADRFLDRRYKSAVEGYYAARNYAPLWSDNGAESAHARDASAYLAGVDADGLEPGDYPVPSFTNTDPGALAEAELKFTSALLTFARHAQIGRVHYSRVSADVFYDQVAPEPAAVLAKLADAKNVGAALDSFNPPQEGYKALKAKLAEVRGRTGDAGPRHLAEGEVLKVGMSDPRVAMLRERLGVAGAPDNTIYDKALADAVKKFQRQHGLAQTGLLNDTTVEALNGPRHDRDADIIIANMERWRWMPRDLGKAYVMVNIPDYTLKVVDRGEVVWTTRIVTGKPGDKATPLLSETMKYITVNPTWNVPPSIINNEYLPALAQDPTVLDRMGLKLEHNRDGTVHIFQPPGERNALGRVRFNFPNKFLVYQHDTPDKYLFALDKRAYSHGCMRVQYPDKYAEVLLNISNPHDGYTADKIRRMYGGPEHDIQLNNPIPVHLTYQTAYVDASGHLVIREDIYGRDSRMLAALKSDDRRVADTPVEHPVAAKRQVARMPQQPPNLFRFLFH